MRTTTLTTLIGLWLVLCVALAQAEDRIYYFHNDHLGTPQVMTEVTGQKVWEAEYDPFGKATVNEDSDGNGQIVVNNLRFPGQYYDAESGLHYNYHRDYDPSTGRYLQPDPIGLEGGLNLYPYALNNPVSHTDRYGLATGVEELTLLGFGLGGPAGALIGFGAGVAIGYVGWRVYHRPSSFEARGKSDPAWTTNYGRVSPGMDPSGKCNPCPSDSPTWTTPGQKGCQGHQIVYDQLPPPLCTCIPKRVHL